MKPDVIEKAARQSRKLPKVNGKDKLADIKEVYRGKGPSQIACNYGSPEKWVRNRQTKKGTPIPARHCGFERDQEVSEKHSIADPKGSLSEICPGNWAGLED